MEEDFTVTVKDLRYLREGNTGFCVRGIKAWAASHGLDFEDFVRNGIKASTLIATGDTLALQVVERMKKERRHGNG